VAFYSTVNINTGRKKKGSLPSLESKTKASTNNDQVKKKKKNTMTVGEEELNVPVKVAGSPSQEQPNAKLPDVETGVVRPVVTNVIIQADQAQPGCIRSCQIGISTFIKVSGTFFFLLLLLLLMSQC